MPSFFSVLKNAYHYTAQNIIREEKKYQILYDIIHRMELEYEDEQEFMSGVLSEISLVKMKGSIGTLLCKELCGRYFPKDLSAV